MKKRDFYLPSSDGKSRLHCVEWMPEPAGRVANSPERADLPEGKPDPAVQKSRAEIKLWVQLVHGMNEHMGRYGEFAAFLAEHGIAVIGHDCLGHGSTAAYGATELSKEDRGFFATENGGAFLLRDMRRVASYGAKRYPNAKHIMLGHSMGSFLTRRYLSAYPGKEPDGVILLGTGFPALPLVFTGEMLASLFGKRKGKHYRSRLLYELSIGNYNRKFQPVRTDYDWLTRDERYVDRFLNNPRCDFIFTVGAYRDFFHEIHAAEKAEMVGYMPTVIPYLILSGDKDPVGENGKGVKKLAALYRKVGIQDITMKLYLGARHEVLNEVNREEVFEDILRWLTEKYNIIF